MSITSIRADWDGLDYSKCYGTRWKHYDRRQSTYSSEDMHRQYSVSLEFEAWRSLGSMACQANDPHRERLAIEAGRVRRKLWVFARDDSA